MLSFFYFPFAVHLFLYTHWLKNLAISWYVFSIYIRVSQKNKSSVIAGNDGWVNYKMILLLLFLISSTLRSSDAQKPKPKNTFFSVNKECRWNLKYFFGGFFGWVKYGKWCKLIKKIVYQISENPGKGFFYNRWIGGWKN